MSSLQPSEAILGIETRDEEGDLINHASMLGEYIMERPLENLKPFASQIDALSAAYAHISASVHAQLSSSASSEPLLARCNAGNALQEVNATHEPRPSHKAANQLLIATTSIIPTIIEAVDMLTDTVMAQCATNPRSLHIQGVYTFQGRRLPKLDSAREKIIFICACKSLARDFHSFEQRNGWQPKDVQVAHRILRGEQPRIQQIGKHLTGFVEDQQATSPLRPRWDVSRLDAALRFGIKLEVVDILGQALGFGEGLSLAFGFECVKFTRLSYSSFGHLYAALGSHVGFRKAFANLCQLSGAQWTTFSSEYHERFGDVNSEHVDDAAGHSTRAIASGAEPLLQPHENVFKDCFNEVESYCGYLDEACWDSLTIDLFPGDPTFTEASWSVDP